MLLLSCYIFQYVLSFWLHWVFVVAHRLSLVAASRGCSSLMCTSFSLQGLLLLLKSTCAPAAARGQGPPFWCRQAGGVSSRGWWGDAQLWGLPESSSLKKVSSPRKRSKKFCHLQDNLEKKSDPYLTPWVKIQSRWMKNLKHQQQYFQTVQAFCLLFLRSVFSFLHVPFCSSRRRDAHTFDGVTPPGCLLVLIIFSALSTSL